MSQIVTLASKSTLTWIAFVAALAVIFCSGPVLGIYAVVSGSYLAGPAAVALIVTSVLIGDALVGRNAESA